MQPLVTLQDNGTGTVLSYDVPQPTIYRGRVSYQVAVNPTFFKRVDSPFPTTNPTLTVAAVRKAMIEGFTDQTIFPLIGIPPNFVAYVDDKSDVPNRYRPWQGAGGDVQVNKNAWYQGLVVIGVHGWNAEAGFYVAPQVGFAEIKDPYITYELAMLTPEVVHRRLAAGYRLFILKNNAGQYTCEWSLADAGADVGIAILERYQLSSFLGNYGAGRTLQTFTLLPGERAKLNIKSYVRTATTKKSASSVLDSYDNQSAQEFSDSVAEEQTNQLNSKDSKKWHVELSAESDWGFVSAQVSAGYKGGVNASREQFGKEMSHAVSKHATKASAKRDIKIQQSQEVTTETGEENGVERELQNVNVGRTLNFVFRQMNQEFITLLHLVDVELVYTTGYQGSGQRYALADLEKFLTDKVVEANRDSVREKILAELSAIIDFRGNQQSFIEQVKIQLAAEDVYTTDRGSATYYRPRRSLTSSYTSQGGKVIDNITGIILSATETVLRTSGVIVEALLGQGEGLDDYSKNLQSAAASSAQSANNLTGALASRKELARVIATNGDAVSAQLYAMLYPSETCPPLPAARPSK